MHQAIQTIDPVHLAEAKATLQGSLPLEQMSRLASLCLPPRGEVAYTLNLSKDENGLCVIHGYIMAKVQLECQRCMKAMAYSLETEFYLSPIHVETEAANLPKAYEPVLLKENKIFLETLIEDEVILNLPLVALHELQECEVKITTQASEELEGVQNKPFTVLGKLKSRNKQ